MGVIKILDCTLRDGGYINDWKFGQHNIRSMLDRLTKAQIDIVECGFLEDAPYDEDGSLFNDVEQIENLLPEDRGITEFVAMTRYGCLDINRLQNYDGRSINGIRVTFHEEEAEAAIRFCKEIQQKGYKVYVQPVGTTSYTDSYLLKIIEIVNAIQPYAFYIVDTLGLMRKNDLLRMFYLVDNNLDPDIVLGFHSHNNLQLSFSNAQELADIRTKRTIFLDSSVHGMGRGAGNLNTELIAQYLNAVKNRNYGTDYLLEIIDETINGLLDKYSWGYSVPYYLAAINNCHPNYATYLMNRKTLPVKSISNILQTITQDQRELYNEHYIQALYTQYQKHQIDDSAALQALSGIMSGREVLVLAPGRSVRKQASQILDLIETYRAVVLSVNFDGDLVAPDYCFFSNDKRYQKFVETHKDSMYRMILTSNIKDSSAEFTVNYSGFLNSQPLVNDNATLMLLALLIKLQVKRVHIAGFDGFQSNVHENYTENELETNLDEATMLEMNRQIAKVVGEYAEKIEMNFITKSLYATPALAGLR